MDFRASKVNIVAEPFKENVVMKVTVGDGLISTIDVDGPRLYNVYDGGYGSYNLRLDVSEGFSFNAFTFG